MSSPRLLTTLLASLLLVASAVALDRGRTTAEDPAAAPSPTATEEPTDRPTNGDAEREDPPSPTDREDATEEQLALLTSTDAAVTAGAEPVLAAGLAVAQGPWRSLTDPAWPVRDERPVYVAEVTISPDGNRVEADVVIAWRTSDVDEVVLRALAASRVLGEAGGSFELTAELDGEPVDVEIDEDGARVLLSGPFEADSAHLLRLDVAFDLVDSERLAGDGGPAGFGILARHEATEARPATANLGHWLPLLTFDDGPMVDWGDVGGSPVAIWSVVIEHPGVVVTGGADGPCPEGQDRDETCTWGRGVSLRDVSAVWFDTEPTTEAEVAGSLEIKTLVPAGTHASGVNRQALLESVGSAEVFSAAFGPLAWRELDVVAAPLLEGAAGMEFPGLVLIDLEVFGALNGRIGTYVIAHEVAHQWFHALVGNGSLSDPVIDESLAQYLSYLFWAEAYGEEAAEQFAAEVLRGRYAAARQRGLEDEPPAQPLEEFDGDGAYTTLVYARAPLAFVAAEERIGRPGVVQFLVELVAEYGLSEITDDEFLEEAQAFDRALGGVIERYWFDPAPLATDTN